MRIGCIAALLVFPASFLYSQAASCPAAPARTATPADTAYSENQFAQAEDLYASAVAEHPQDAQLIAALAHTLLHEGKITQAADRVTTALAGDLHSAALLTAQAEVQLRQGQPWLALQTLDAAAAADHCYARIHLIRSRVLRIDSMYASERAEITSAYEIDPEDPDILHAWRSVVNPAHEIEGIEQALATMKDLDAETRQKSEASANALLLLLSENSQTCKVLPTVPSATLSLMGTMEDGKHLDGYRLEAQFPKTGAKLQLDTAASGLFITKALAAANSLEQNANDPSGTVRAESVRIGSLEFRDCMVGVTDGSFPGKADGAIGTDVFSSYLITINARDAKMILDPLPPQAGILPGDRAIPAELADYMPVYHRRHYLLVPVTLNNKTRKLFVLDLGMRLSAMTPDAAHSVSSIKANFTNPMQTASGPPAQVYRDNFDFQFASLSLTHQNHVLEWDPSVIDRNAGFQVAGLLGFDMLHSLTMHLDYRDGLVKFEPTSTEASPVLSKGTMTASAAPGNEPGNIACPQNDQTDRPINQTIEATISGTLESAHLKPGKEIWAKLVNGYVFPGCTLDRDALIYGHVTAANSTKNPETSELALTFDHGDCEGHGKKELSLRLIGLLAPPDQSSNSLADALPTEVAGGARRMSDTSAMTDGYDPRLNPGGPPRTVHPGIVVDMPKLKLDPQGGPGCSARISSANRSVELGAGAELILAMYGPK